jgi:hypothetical protein
MGGGKHFGMVPANYCHVVKSGLLNKPNNTLIGFAG